MVETPREILASRLAEVSAQYFSAETWVRESWDYGCLAHSSAAQVRDALRLRVSILRAALDSIEE